MEPDKVRDRKPHPTHDEFGVSHSAGELGRPAKRSMLQQQSQAGESNASCAHGVDSSFDTLASPPQHDRAG